MTNPGIRHGLRRTGAAAAALAALLSGLTASAAGAEESALEGNLSTVVVEGTPATGPALTAQGANSYAADAADIARAPGGASAPLTDVLAHMPGVAIDQNQQIHIRNTEGPQFQYQVNGVLLPLDLNTNPSFLSMFNPLFIERLELLDGVLPARYSYATGGVVNIETKDGCAHPFTSLSVRAGQRATLEPSIEVAGCPGRLSSYVSAFVQESDTAFSSATPGPTPLHDHGTQGQLLGFFSYPASATSSLSLLVSAARSRNELPNVPDLAPLYALAGASAPPSSLIDSRLNFDDALAMLTLHGTLAGGLSYQLALGEHSISQRFEPDLVGELTYQGVASRAGHVDHDTTLEGDLEVTEGAHELGAGFYAGDYRVSARDSSLVFPADAAGNQTSDVPLMVSADARAVNRVTGLYVSDLWHIAGPLSASLGLRWDSLSGFTRDSQLDPSLNLIYRTERTTYHMGGARYFQIPSLLGISPGTQAAFAGTTAAGPPGIATPMTEDDREWDAGFVHRLTERLTVSGDAYTEWTHHYLDTGQFGVVPIFAPFNYGTGHMWGVELSAHYRSEPFSAYGSLTSGRNWQRGVATGQFNFPADELSYIDTHSIVVDHQPLIGATAGATWRVGTYSFSADGLYSSGLRAGFADLEKLPHVVQVNLSLERAFQLSAGTQVTNRLSVINAFDRVNLIRPANGIGIFQAGYGPRLTLFDTVTVRF